MSSVHVYASPVGYLFINIVARPQLALFTFFVLVSESFLPARIGVAHLAQQDADAPNAALEATRIAASNAGPSFVIDSEAGWDREWSD